LDYVRYRHGDNDLVRAARQQDFIRQLTHQAGVRKLLDISQRERLVRIFARYFDVDKSFLQPQTIISMLKQAIYLTGKNAEVHEIRFPATEAPDPVQDTYLYVSHKALRSVYRQFMAGRGSAVPRRA